MNQQTDVAIRLGSLMQSFSQDVEAQLCKIPIVEVQFVYFFLKILTGSLIAKRYKVDGGSQEKSRSVLAVIAVTLYLPLELYM